MSATSVQFSVATHIMAVIAYSKDAQTCSSSLAQSVHAEPSFVRKSLSKLAKAGLVVTTRGKHGRCTLARPPESITLRDIYIASEAPKSFAVHNYAAEQMCPISSNIRICMSAIQFEAQQGLEKALAKTTLADLVTDIERAELQKSTEADMCAL